MREKDDIFVTDISRYDVWIQKKKMQGYDKLFEFFFRPNDRTLPKKYKNQRDFLTKLFT